MKSFWIALFSSKKLQIFVTADIWMGLCRIDVKCRRSFARPVWSVNDRVIGVTIGDQWSVIRRDDWFDIGQLCTGCYSTSNGTPCDLVLSTAMTLWPCDTHDSLLKRKYYGSRDSKCTTGSSSLYTTSIIHMRRTWSHRFKSQGHTVDYLSLLLVPILASNTKEVPEYPGK